MLKSSQNTGFPAQGSLEPEDDELLVEVDVEAVPLLEAPATDDDEELEAGMPLDEPDAEDDESACDAPDEVEAVAELVAPELLEAAEWVEGWPDVADALEVDPALVEVPVVAPDGWAQTPAEQTKPVAQSAVVWQAKLLVLVLMPTLQAASPRAATEAAAHRLRLAPPGSPTGETRCWVMGIPCQLDADTNEASGSEPRSGSAPSMQRLVG